MGRVDGVPVVLANMEKFNRRLTKALVRDVEKVAVAVANDAKKNHNRRPTKERFKKGMLIYARRAAHAYGRYQNVTGNLTQSIIAKDAVVTSDTITSTVSAGAGGGKTLEYAAAVEYGTAKTRAFPYLYPALRAHEKELPERANATVREMTRQ